MKVPVLSIKNEKVSEVDLPKVFETPVRHDIIKRAVSVKTGLPLGDITFLNIITHPIFRKKLN